MTAVDPVLRRLRLAGFATTVAVLAVACAGTTSAPPAGTTTATPEAATTAATSPVDPGAMRTDEAAAVRAVDTFWRTHFSEHFDGDYRSPRVEGSYIGANGPSCGGEPSVPFNAFYCGPGDFLAWDQQLMEAGYSQIGDAWIYLIIAHEWGHAIQARLNRDQVSVQAELQADCLAGAALQGAADDGLIKIEPGDSEELAKTLAAVADDYPWTKESDHGNAQERTDAFNTGVQGGVPACA